MYNNMLRKQTILVVRKLWDYNYNVKIIFDSWSLQVHQRFLHHRIKRKAFITPTLQIKAWMRVGNSEKYLGDKSNYIYRFNYSKFHIL